MSDLGEIWTAEEKAEFLLNNSLNEEDYRGAIEEVLKLGVDPLALNPDYLFRDRAWQRAELYLQERKAKPTP